MMENEWILYIIYIYIYVYIYCVYIHMQIWQEVTESSLSYPSRERETNPKAHHLGTINGDIHM